MRFETLRDGPRGSARQMKFRRYIDSRAATQRSPSASEPASLQKQHRPEHCKHARHQPHARERVVLGQALLGNVPTDCVRIDSAIGRKPRITGREQYQSQGRMGSKLRGPLLVTLHRSQIILLIPYGCGGSPIPAGKFMLAKTTTNTAAVIGPRRLTVELASRRHP